MPDFQRHLDIGSRLVILVTFVLFVVALFIKGLGHDLLLEGGVFLVSVKLIMMAYKNSVATRQLNDRLDQLQATLTRMEGTPGPGRSS
jgi:Flp pilus assembly protein TadB